MIYPPLQRNMLPDANSHILCRGHVDHRWFTGVGIWNPERDGESICCATESDRQRAYEVEEES